MTDPGTEKRQRAVGGTAFMIRIQYRQNASWQGTIQWLDGKKTVPFRSLLEMLLLMKEALEQAPASGQEARLPSWEDKEEVG